MGLGNLMMLPLRVLFLVEARSGHEYSPASVALIMGFVPSVTQFVFSPLWGHLFDRINFFVLRNSINAIFILSHTLFFLGGTCWALFVGAFLLGLAAAGGNIAWSLWVTKIAPAGYAADYMSVYTFTTGYARSPRR